MRQVSVWSVLVCLSLAGCGNEININTGASSPTASKGTPEGASSSGGAAPAKRTPAPGMRAVALSPKNTQLEFVCIHMPPKAADPRKGGFDNFTGLAEIDPATKALTSLSVDIVTDSIRTEVGAMLTGHLKSPDFFNVAEFPEASFQSTSIKAEGEPGSYMVTGDLTLHGVTKPISFPATVSMDGDKLSLTTSFKFDRTEWGINFDPNQVARDVSITVAINEK